MRSSFWSVLVLMSCARVASAEGEHARVERALQEVVERLPAEARTRTRGVYVAFDPSRSDALAQAACDDDGDYVIVVSEAMTQLLERAALAFGLDAAGAKNAVSSFRAALSNQPLGADLLPLPVGAFDRSIDTPSYERAWSTAARFLVASELSHATSGRLVCPRPTPSRERGDDVWTTSERVAAREAAVALYPTRVERADESGLRALFMAGDREDGALAWLSLTTALAASSYTRTHGASRSERLSRWADAWRSAGIEGSPQSL